MFGQTWDSNCMVNGVATLSCIFPLFHNIVTSALILSGVVALFMILYAGYKFIRSNGDPKQVDGARQIMIYAIFGIFLIMFSFLIINVIAYVTNVECLKTFSFDSCKSPDATTPDVTQVDPATTTQ